MKPLLLCIHTDAGRLMRLSMLALSLGIQVKEVKPAQWGLPLGALCGLDASKKPGPAQVGEEMLVMAFFPDGLIDTLFQTMRQSGLAVTRLRAVLTPTNRSWHCGRLYTELSREVTALNAGRRAGT